MYFVVYSLEDKEYYVIPKRWIKDLNFENIVNKVINCSLRYRCFSGPDEDAWINGFPNEEYVPNFIGNENSYFTANLVKYFGMDSNEII